MAYLPRRARVLNGLSGVESCGPDQVWDPNIEYMGFKGQCMPRSKYTAAQLVNPNAFPGVVKSASTGPNPITAAASAIFGSLIGSVTQPKPQQPVVIQQPASSGISPAVAVGVGVGALALILIATR